MRGRFYLVLLTTTLLFPSISFCLEGRISIHFDSYAERISKRASSPLFSLPPEEWSQRYGGESFVYVPGERAHVTVEVPPGETAANTQIAVQRFISGERRVLHRGPLKPGAYGPFEIPIASDFEVYRVQVMLGKETETKSFCGIRPWRGMKDFSEAVSTCRIVLSYEKSTPWDAAVKEGHVPPDMLDLNWALSSHVERGCSVREDWWLWTHYACGMVGLDGGRTGLFWGEYNPWIRSKPNDPEGAGFATETMLPNEIYFHESIRPMLRKWAEALSEKHPGIPLTISLGDGWGIGQGIGRHFGPEILRFFVSWMKEYFDITIEAETLRELIEKCRQYPKHFDYFIARNTTFRSLELTCQAVQDVVAGSKAWDRYGESNRELITLPEAAEFCQILSRNIAVGTSDDRAAWRLTDGNPLPYGFSNMVVKALAPEHNLCVGWSGCGAAATAGEIYRWYLEPAWLTTYDMDGKLRHVYTHSPPKGPDGVWRCLVEEARAPDEKIVAHDKCFQVMEAIGVEKPIGPVFVCKDWTFADDKSSTAFRSDLYEKFLISLRRHKVPISCAVHADYESKLPEDVPRVYAPRMDGEGNIRFGFRAGPVNKWFRCAADEIPDSLMGEFASLLNSACGNRVVFPSKSSIEGYAFEAKGMIFVVAEEMAGQNEQAEIRVKVAEGRWNVIDLIGGKPVQSKQGGQYVVFTASLEANSARLYCIVQRSPE